MDRDLTRKGRVCLRSNLCTSLFNFAKRSRNSVVPTELV